MKRVGILRLIGMNKKYFINIFQIAYVRFNNYLSNA